MVHTVTVIYCLCENIFVVDVFRYTFSSKFGPPEMPMESLLVYLQIKCEYIAHITFTTVTLQERSKC